MTLIKWKNEPASTMPSLFNDFFGDFFNDSLSRRDFFKSAPAVNITDRENDYIIEMAAPGYDKNAFKVNVEDDVLTISAEKEGESTDESNRYTRKEFSYSSFQRRFTMPDHVEADKIGAEYKDGLLKITLPKNEKGKVKPSREIKIS